MEKELTIRREKEEEMSKAGRDEAKGENCENLEGQNSDKEKINVRKQGAVKAYLWKINRRKKPKPKY